VSVDRQRDDVVQRVDACVSAEAVSVVFTRRHQHNKNYAHTQRAHRQLNVLNDAVETITERFLARFLPRFERVLSAGTAGGRSTKCLRSVLL